MAHNDPDRTSIEETRLEDLRGENEALRRRVAELEVPARRYQALFDGGVVSVQIYDPDGCSREANSGWEELWQIPHKEIAGRYVILQDAQVVAGGFMALVERAFRHGKATKLPTIRYDPVKNDTVGKGAARWVASVLCPVEGLSGVCEVVQVHVDVGELKQSEDDLRAQAVRLEEAVAQRTADLAEQLRISEEQQRAIDALSTPVLRVWDGILAVPLMGRIDADRAARVLDVLLRRIVANSVEHVIIDVTGVPHIDAEAARHLRDTMRAAGLLGAQCMIVGISAKTAQMLAECGLDFEGSPTFASLQEGLRRLLSHR